jgi:glutathione peroxidase-family protein
LVFHRLLCSAIYLAIVGLPCHEFAVNWFAVRFNFAIVGLPCHDFAVNWFAVRFNFAIVGLPCNDFALIGLQCALTSQ